MNAKFIFSVIVVAVLSMGTSYTLAGNDRENDFHRVQIGVSFSPNYCYRTLKGNRENTFYDLRNEREEARFGYNGGFNISFNVNKMFGIGSGIQYSDKGFRTGKGYWLSEFPDLNPDYFLDVWHITIHRFHYIEIPLKAQFSIGGEKVRFLSGIGFTTGFLVKATNTIQSNVREDMLSNDTEKYNRINLFPTMSIGIDYKITPKSSIRIEPTFWYGLLNTFKSMKESGFISEYLWSAGVNVSYLVGIK